MNVVFKGLLQFTLFKQFWPMFNLGALTRNLLYVTFYDANEWWQSHIPYNFQKNAFIIMALQYIKIYNNGNNF